MFPSLCDRMRILGGSIGLCVQRNSSTYDASIHKSPTPRIKRIDTHTRSHAHLATPSIGRAHRARSTRARPSLTRL